MTNTGPNPDQRDPQVYLDLDEKWCAHNYRPLPVVLTSAQGAWVTDVTGKRYLDMLAGYSALNFGHQHPDLIAAAIRQMGSVTLTSTQSAEGAGPRNLQVGLRVNF